MQSRYGNQQPPSSKEQAPFHEDLIQTMHPTMQQVHVEKQERAEGVVSLDENDQMRSSRRLTMSTHRSMLGSGHVESLAANGELSNTACNSHMLLQPPTTSGETHVHQGGNIPTRPVMPPQQHACEGEQNWNEKIEATTNRVKEVSQQQQLSTMKEKHQQIENDDHPESHHRVFMLDNSNDQQTSPKLTHADQSTIASSSTSVHQQHHHSHVTLQHAKVKVSKSSRNRSSSKTKIQQHSDASSTLQQMHHHPSEENTPSGSGTSSPFAIVDETTRTRKKAKKHHQLMTTGESEQKPGKIKIYAFERPLMNENENFTDNYFVLTPTITNASNMPSSSSSGNSTSSTATTSISARSSDEQAQQTSSTNALSKPSQNLPLVQPRKRTKKSSMNENPSSTTHLTASTRNNEEQISSQQAPTLNSNISSNESITMLGNNNVDNPSENSQNQSSSLEVQKSALGEFLKRFLHFTSSTTSNIFTQPAQNEILQAQEAILTTPTQPTSFQEPQVQQPLLQQIAPMLNVLSGLNSTNQQAATALPSALSLPVGGQQVDPNALISIIDSILSREMTNRCNQETMTPHSDSQQPTSSSFIHSPSFSQHDNNVSNSFISSNTTNLSFSNKGDPWEEQKISASTTIFGTALPQQDDLPQPQNFGMISSSGPRTQQQEQHHNQSPQQQQPVNIVSNTQQLLMEALANFATQQHKTQQTFPSTSHSQQLPQHQLLSSSTTLKPSDFPNDPIYNISFPFEQTSMQYHHNPPTLNIMDMFQLLRQAPDNDPLKRLFLQCLSIVQQQEKNK